MANPDYCLPSPTQSGLGEHARLSHRPLHLHTVLRCRSSEFASGHPPPIARNRNRGFRCEPQVLGGKKWPEIGSQAGGDPGHVEQIAEEQQRVLPGSV